MINETTGYKICRTARKIHQYMTKAMAEYDITPEQWVVLQVVSDATGLSQQNLAQRLEKDKNSTKALVDRLIKKNLLQRQRSTADQRLYQLQLTDKGRSLTEKMTVLDRVFMQELEQAVTAEELEHFLQILDKLEKKITTAL